MHGNSELHYSDFDIIVGRSADAECVPNSPCGTTENPQKRVPEMFGTLTRVPPWLSCAYLHGVRTIRESLMCAHDAQGTRDASLPSFLGRSAKGVMQPMPHLTTPSSVLVARAIVGHVVKGGEGASSPSR